jgi:predicted Zn-dependent protease
VLLCQVHRFDESEAACRQVLARKPRDPFLLYVLAEACHGQGKNEETQAALAALPPSQRRLPRAAVLQALVCCETNREAEAIPLLRQVLGQNPADQQARYHLSLALARTGQAAAAAREMAEMLKHQAAESLLRDIPNRPFDLGLKVRAAEALWQCGRIQEAVQLAQRVLGEDPRRRGAHLLLARYYERQGSRERAASHRRQAELFPERGD